MQESPEVHHLWCGLTGVAATLSRNVWLPRISGDGIERYRSYPGQMMTVLVAGPGLTRKSTALGIIQSLLKEANACRLFVGKITPEALLSKLGSFEDRRAVLTIIADEMSVLLSKQQYAEPMVNLLLKLANALDDDEYETQRFKIRLLNACLTMLLATTPSSLGLSIPPEAHQHGFMSRVCYVYAERSDKVEPLATDPSSVSQEIRAASSALRARLVQGLRDMSRLKGPWEWSGRKWFIDWYRGYKDSVESEGEGWPSRRAEHLVRLAMCLRVARDLQLDLDEQSLIAADVMLKAHIESNFSRTFAYIGRHANAEQLRRIVSLFPGKNEVLTSDEIYYKTIRYFSDSKALQLAMEALKQAGVLKHLEIDTTTGDEKWQLIRELY